MKRVLLAVVFALCLPLAFNPIAGAAEIPPTAECAELMRTLTIENGKKLSGDIKPKQARKANLKMLKELKAAGCISAVKPLLKTMKPSPDTQECADAAVAAEDFWNPTSDTLEVIGREYGKYERPFLKKKNAIRRQILKLRRTDGSKKKIRRLQRQKSAAWKKFSRDTKHLNRQMLKLVRPQAYDTTLILTELFAMRCLNDKFFAEIFKPANKRTEVKGPVAKVIDKNFYLIWVSLLMTWSDSLGSGDDDKSSSGESSVDIASISSLGVEAGPARVVPLNQP